MQLNDDSDEVWVANRHLHIGAVSEKLDSMKKELKSSDALIIKKKIEQHDKVSHPYV